MKDEPLRQTALASFVPALVARRFAACPAPAREPAAEVVPGAVLFADIGGFTALTERLAEQGPEGAERLTSLLNAWFGRLIALIGEHGGEVVKFAGDALLALFHAGGPDDAALAGAALAAGRCGLAVQGRLSAEVSGAAEARLTLRIGVGVGAVDVLYVGARERWECVPTGAPLRQVVAAERQAAPGDVVLSPDAWARVGEGCFGTPAEGGCVRLTAVFPDAPAPFARPLPVAPDEALAPFVSGAIRARVAAGQTDWLSELRRVTVLFVNLPGLDPGAPDFLARTQLAFETVQGTVEQVEGSIDKLAHDDKGLVVLAALGLPPHAHEDDAVRGVRAAQALREALVARGFGAAIGVTTGRVFCGVVGSPERREYTVMGDAVNLAARLMQHAGGAVLCDAATAEAARGAFAFEPLAPLRLKGKAQPVAVFAPREGRAASGPGALVGRARERHALREALDALVAGESRLVLVEGDAGIGKSVLLAELLAQAGARGVRCLAGAADSIEPGTPYYAWRPIAAQLLGLDELERGDRAGRTRRVRAQMEDDPVLARLAPLLRDVVGADLPDSELTAAMSGEVRAHNTQDLLVHLLQRAAAGDGERARPLVVALEDAHWLDSASWALLRQVLARVAPLLLVITSRPPADPAPPEYARLRDAGALYLALPPLTRAETEALLERRLGRPPSARLARLVHERSGGHPFFADELTLALRDTAALVARDGVLDLPGPGGAGAGDDDGHGLTLPDTVQGTILARIDRLDPRQQLAVKVASVIGRRFALDVLRDVYPVEPDRPLLRQKLDELERADWTSLEAPEPAPVWQYKQELTREVAYGLLLFSQRRQLHRAVAERLEAIPPESRAPLYGRLAWHWGRAEAPAKTLEYLEKAGAHALVEGAYAEAAQALRQALRQDAAQAGEGDGRAPERRRRRAHWERLLGEALLGLGDLPASRAALERAVAGLGVPVPGSTLGLVASLGRGALSQVVRRLAPPALTRRVARGRPTAERDVLREAALAYLRLLETYFFLAGPTETLDAALHALNLADAAGPSPELARACALTGWIVSMVPQPALSDRYLRLAAELVATPEGRAARQPVLFFTGFSRAAAGRWTEARAALEEAVALAEELGDKRRWIEGVCGLSTVLHYQGEYERRVQMGSDVLYASARRQGDVQAEAWGLLDQLESLIALGDRERTRPLLDALRPFLDKDIGRSEQIWAHGLLALALLRDGDPAGALEAATRATEHSARTAPVAVYCYEGYAAAAEVFLALREARHGATARERAAVARGARAATAALERYARVFPIARPRAQVYRGWLYHLAGRQAAAALSWRRAVEDAERLQMPFEEARARHERARHRPPGDPLRRADLERAAALFESVGATGDLARTRAALA
jgi:class 3 adenylate cyclase/tetratricopeptide (TPR) repeat protein